MDTDDELLAEMVLTVTLDVLARLGDDREAPYAFSKRFLALAQEVVGDRGEQLDRATDY